MGDGRHVLHEANEELRSADRIKLVVRDELRLHARESDLLAALRDTGDRGEHDAVLLSREIGRSKTPARDLVVEGAVHEHRAEE